MIRIPVRQLQPAGVDRIGRTYLIPQLQTSGVNDRNQPTDQAAPAESDARDELRTIAFRLREIQRLLGARVEQENRRLDAAGIDPVSGHAGFGGEDDGRTTDR